MKNCTRFEPKHVHLHHQYELQNVTKLGREAVLDNNTAKEEKLNQQFVNE